MRPVIFMDWDGTVADSMALCIEEVRAALKGVGLPDRTDAELMRCNGPTNEESVAILGIDPARAEAYLRLRAQAELALIPAHQRIFPGMAEALHALKARADLVIVSNGLAEYLHRSAAFLGVEDCFLRMEGMREGLNKAQNMARLLAELRPQRAVMVGDRAGDMEAGRVNGLPTIAACYGYGTPEEWALADRQATSVDALREMLLAWAEQ